MDKKDKKLRGQNFVCRAGPPGPGLWCADKQLRGQNFVCRAGPPGPGLWCVMVSAATSPTVLTVRVLCAVHTQPGIGVDLA